MFVTEPDHTFCVNDQFTSKLFRVKIQTGEFFSSILSQRVILRWAGFECTQDLHISIMHQSDTLGLDSAKYVVFC